MDVYCNLSFYTQTHRYINDFISYKFFFYFLFFLAYQVQFNPTQINIRIEFKQVYIPLTVNHIIKPNKFWSERIGSR